jgi:spermidine synthase
LKQLLYVQPSAILALLFVPLLITSGLRIARQDRQDRIDSHFAVLFSVFTTGFSTMALQIALIFAFQSIYGFVYEILGIIMALFMFGLALGAYFTNCCIKDKTNVNTLAVLQLSIALFAGAIAILLPGAAALQSPGLIFALFSLFTLIGGFINGVDFPLSAACAMSIIRRADPSAGVVYSLEVFGACAGATLASVLAAPVWGIAACCWIASAANGAAFLSLVVSRRSRYDKFNPTRPKN